MSTLCTLCRPQQLRTVARRKRRQSESRRRRNGATSFLLSVLPTIFSRNSRKDEEAAAKVIAEKAKREQEEDRKRKEKEDKARQKELKRGALMCLGCAAVIPLGKKFCNNCGAPAPMQLPPPPKKCTKVMRARNVWTFAC
jgi:hypothetical protein